MEHLGKVFREFRTSGNYSLKEAAGESCSTSQLYLALSLGSLTWQSPVSLRFWITFM